MKKKQQAGWLIMVVALLILLNGCATIIHGTTQDVAITTDPSEAELLVDGRENYKSPAKITMKRKEDHMVEVTKDGYQKETINIKSVLSGAVAGNIIAGGLIGWGVDAASGAQNRLVPEHVDLRLRTLQTSEVGKEAGSKDSIEDKLDQVKKLRDTGKITTDEYIQTRKTILENANKSKIASTVKETRPSSPPPVKPTEITKPVEANKPEETVENIPQ